MVTTLGRRHRRSKARLRFPYGVYRIRAMDRPQRRKVMTTMQTLW